MLRVMPAIVKAFLASALILLGACDDQPTDHLCQVESSADECVEGRVCAEDTGGVLRCLRTCESQEDCPVDTLCAPARRSSNVCRTQGFESE
jgi:hypothetical protein